MRLLELFQVKFKYIFITIDIGLNPQQLQGSVAILNQILADEFTLYVKTRNYHWNVVGIHFHDLHKFFEGLYEELDVIVDEVAERARSLNGFAIATLADFSKITKIKEESGHNLNAEQMVKNLLKDHELLIRELRTCIAKTEEDFNDAATTDFLIGLMQRHEKTAWMLRSMTV